MPEFRHYCVILLFKLARHKDKGKTLHLHPAQDQAPDQDL